MNLADARKSITLALERMTALYSAPVFDEWVLAKFSGEQNTVLGYEGPRSDSFQKKFREDVVPLRAEIETWPMTVGDFAFAPEAIGTRFDACIRVGPKSYLFCNNIAKSMEDIRKNPLWLSAQKPFAELSEKFRADPLL